MADRSPNTIVFTATTTAHETDANTALRHPGAEARTQTLADDHACTAAVRSKRTTFEGSATLGMARREGISCAPQYILSPRHGMHSRAAKGGDASRKTTSTCAGFSLAKLPKPEKHRNKDDAPNKTPESNEYIASNSTNIPQNYQTSHQYCNPKADKTYSPEIFSFVFPHCFIHLLFRHHGSYIERLMFELVSRKAHPTKPVTRGVQNTWDGALAISTQWVCVGRKQWEIVWVLLLPKQQYGIAYQHNDNHGDHKNGSVAIYILFNGNVVYRSRYRYRWHGKHMLSDKWIRTKKNIDNHIQPRDYHNKKDSYKPFQRMFGCSNIYYDGCDCRTKKDKVNDDNPLNIHRRFHALYSLEQSFYSFFTYSTWQPLIWLACAKFPLLFSLHPRRCAYDNL